MASQVLSGSNNVSYTNNTGQNVRVVINYMGYVTIPLAQVFPGDTSGQIFNGIVVNWAGVSANATLAAIGRNLAFNNSESATFLAGSGAVSANNGLGSPFGPFDGALPTEIMLAPGQTFSARCSAYNIVVIPEAG